MTYIFVTLGLIITYFVITAIKENEARETIERERKINMKKMANVHFDNLVANELKRQEIMQETRKLFIQQLEKEEGIYKVTFDENKLNIIVENNIDTEMANNEARVWIETLLPTTWVDIVNIYNRVGLLCGSADRNVIETKIGNEIVNSTNNHSLESNFQKDFTVEFSESEKAKFKISTLFYNFCFSANTSKILKEGETRGNFASMLKRTTFKSEKTLQNMFWGFAKMKYQIILEKSADNFYKIDGFEFFMEEIRLPCVEGESYFQLLYNDLEDVRNEENDEMAVAVGFTLYCVDDVPSAIFVLVFDPIIGKSALRRVFEDGTSVRLAFIENYDSACIDFLKDYVSKINF